MEEPTNMDGGAQVRQLLLRAYVVTIGLAVLINLLTIILLVDTTNCGSVSRGLGVMDVTTAVVFLASVAVVGVRARKVVPDLGRRWALVGMYALFLLANFVIMACGLMVVFNC